MLGTGNKGKWPGEEEIDIMESRNGDPKLYMSLHSTHHNAANAQHPSVRRLEANADFSRDGAILGLEWNVQDKKGRIDLTWWTTYYDLGKKSWKSMHTTKSLIKSKGKEHDYIEFYNSFVVYSPPRFSIISWASSSNLGMPVLPKEHTSLFER